MALLAEELVQEWLNRSGFFTIRGVKLGVHEMNLLAVRPTANGLECRHVEVQASVNPVSYLFRLTKEDQKATGRAATSSGTRTPDQLERGANEWIAKKFDHPQKRSMLARLAPGCTWSRELVVHRMKYPEELMLLANRGIVVHQLESVLRDLAEPESLIARASGGDFLDLVFLGTTGTLVESARTE
ncbi:MAG: hypothetical protein KF857_09990 [Fimbriimonadaceae bacterium]|nr:hypothetical protein [Fimbriimonadaceae bacterium]